MPKFIQLTSNKSERPVLVNADSIAWVSVKETGGKKLTVIYFSAAYPSEPLSVIVKEEYDAVVKMITT